MLFRSLTKRQRELLQEYADDVEGRKRAKAEASSSQKEELSHSDNGTDSFTHWSPPPGGWISRTWQNIRGLIGF
jgi:molecular chaperone DnaJ